MEEFDHAAYLTQRLRTLQPESYELEVQRATRRAKRIGMLVGSIGSLMVVAVATAVIYLTPGSWGALVAALD